MRFNKGFPYLAAVSLLGATSVSATQFNPMFLKDKGAQVDLRFFEKSNGMLPGTYSVDLYLNQRLERRQDIAFKADGKAEKDDAQPILSLGLLREIGVDVERLKKEGIVPIDSGDAEPVALPRIEGASVEMDVSKLALYLSVPQAYIKRRSRGYVDPSLWDDGVTAFFSNYQLSLSRNSGYGTRSDYGYLGLRNGFNLGQWRLRNESSISQSTGVSRNFSSNRTYLEHDVTALKGRFAIGQLYTSGDIFDSSRFRGVQLGSDVGMLPDNEAGYAPVVRGIAESHATVEVRQNGYVIYSTSVSPGAFEIRDIYPGGSNGDLEITVIESDGRKRKFTQAYSYLPVMVRRGTFQYSLSLGKYDNDSSESPHLLQGTAVYGATDNLTTYGGMLGADGYTAFNLGLGLNTPLGGTSLDVTNSHSRPDHGKATSGQSARFLYSKTLNSTNTTFTMVGYRYSTAGYRTLSDHIQEMGEVDHQSFARGRPKNRLDLNINQTLGNYGSLFLSAGETNYWDRSGNMQRLQLGYSGNLGEVSYSISASHTRSAGGSADTDNQLSFSVSIPFGSRPHSQRLYSSYTSSSRGDDSLQAGVSGYLDNASTLSYSAQTGQYGSEHSSSVGLAWDAPSAKLAGNYSKSGDSRHLDLTASGSMVAHSGGVTFSQPVGETFALVEVPGVKGVGIGGSTARTDGAGYTVEGYVQPYRYNYLNLDTQTLGVDVDVDETSQRVVPRRGAVVKARFAAASGRRVQLDLSLADGRKLPFGAQVSDASGKLLAVVDNQSRALVFGLEDQGRLTVSWADGTCSAPYTLPRRDASLTYDQVKLVCGVQSSDGANP
ncbi:fimbrial biogenesis outer membrane usher protein [Pseudomonas sp. ADPe]|uniref:fimbria/pilus outer membrane usher protein n=1 Tax=Pseudomonas sp. ADPe TaxID=2774873 RepID=UPI0009F57423|nr:fimbria/pilus outer membrane usher protein [Pseudomonas sp. EGD-AKN5]QOF86068.1 fimbrial biogenesis outer membrane usher protein [Pseudomonas sp. ADPe]